MNNSEKIALKLIREDLISMRLIEGLNKLGLDATDYISGLSEVIFQLIGFDQSWHKSDVLQSHYLTTVECYLDVDPEELRQKSRDWSREIFIELRRYKESIEDNKIKLH